MCKRASWGVGKTLGWALTQRGGYSIVHATYSSKGGLAVYRARTIPNLPYPVQGGVQGALAQFVLDLLQGGYTPKQMAERAALAGGSAIVGTAIVVGATAFGIGTCAESFGLGCAVAAAGVPYGIELFVANPIGEATGAGKLT
jgi:hypothetical protein